MSATDPLTVPERRRAYDRVDEANAFSCLARDWHGGRWTALHRLFDSDGVVDHAHALAVAEECRAACRMIAQTPRRPIEWAEDYPRLVALLQACEEFPAPVN